jgi:hypothetical protein
MCQVGRSNVSHPCLAGMATEVLRVPLEAAIEVSVKEEDLGYIWS